MSQVQTVTYVSGLDKNIYGGERGIRTLGTLARSTVFETAPFDHSGTSPRYLEGNGLQVARNIDRKGFARKRCQRPIGKKIRPDAPWLFPYGLRWLAAAAARRWFAQTAAFEPALAIDLGALLAILPAFAQVRPLRRTLSFTAQRAFRPVWIGAPFKGFKLHPE